MLTAERFLPLIQSLGVLGYLFTFGVSFAEAIAFMGMLIPGMTIVVAMGGLAAHGLYGFWPLTILSAAGAALGDAMSYEFGRVGKRFLHHHPRTWKHIQGAERKFKKHGWVAIGLGRFVAPLRGIMPLAAGVLDLDRSRFYAANIFFAIVWGIGSVSIGYALGSATLAVARTPLEGEWIFLALAGLLILLVWWRRRSRVVLRDV